MHSIIDSRLVDNQAPTYRETLASYPLRPVLVDLFDAEGRAVSSASGVALYDVEAKANRAVVATVGKRFRVPDLEKIGQALDDATALVGGKANLGAPRVTVSERGVSVSVGSSARSMRMVPIQGDPSERSLAVWLRSAFDGSEAESLRVGIVRLLCANGMIGLSDVGESLRRKHTQGLDSDRALWASRAAGAIPAAFARNRALLSGLSDLRIPRADTFATLARVFSFDLDDEKQRKQADNDRTIGRMIDLIRGADGAYVPQAPSETEISALQILEAATAYDTHDHGTNRRGTGSTPAHRAERILSGQGVARDVVRYFAPQLQEAGVL